MKCNIQDTLEINLPEDLSDHPDVYNIEWDNENGQGWEMKNFIALTKDRNLLLDVGAYVGFFSFVFMINNNDDGRKRCYSFEPSAPNFEIMGKIVKYQGDDIRFENMIGYPAFVGEEQKEVGVVVEKNYQTFTPMYERAVPGFPTGPKNHFKVKMVSIDNFNEWLKSEGQIADTIKIDVEGYDFRVLQGARNFLKDDRPLVFLEVHQRMLKLYNNTIINVYDLVNNELEYNFFNNKLELVSTKNDFLQLFADSEVNELRLICSPKEAGNL